MPRRKQTSSRKRIFQDLDNIATSANPVNFGHEHTEALQQLDGGMNNLQETADDNVQLGRRMSSRRRFFQNLNNEEALYVSKTSGNEDENRLGRLSERKSNLGGSDNHSMELGSRRSSIKNIVASKPFEDEHNVSGQLDDRMISPEERVENAPDNLCSFGQANYQRQKQGIIIEYKDFSDNTLQCNHCNAYYWRDERNTREVYTGCCKGGQVRLRFISILNELILIHIVCCYCTSIR
ncbi:PREDICTED: uncharacterized protein LOC101311666 [Fragaria vesca subsp. vesca]